ncbi:MAG: nucleoside transporter C-terminal domain-containing protein [Pirellulales bacterium]|nr:nucleoside transporter C-terminal domain-containing protein [Pirellulales bacterium]
MKESPPAASVTSAAAAEIPLPPTQYFPSTPWHWRAGILAGIIILGVAAYALRQSIGLKGQAAVGIVFFFGLVAAMSANLRAVNWRTIGWGIVLQVVLALLVLQAKFEINGYQYSVYGAFQQAGEGIKQLIEYSNAGAQFVFGFLAKPGAIAPVLGDDNAFVFAFNALPPILFVSALFTLLYHYGILQWLVRQLAHVMVYFMGTSGAETLSVAANVFMGQTEAPLIVKPYVPRMTQSELFTLMTSGMAHISGGLMAIYIKYGADPVAVLTTCIMACPCSMYLAKLYMPEVSTPETSGTIQQKREKSPYANGVDAIASGTGEGLRLALNVAAMLIVFVAFVAMINGVLGGLGSQLAAWTGWDVPPLSLEWIFAQVFSPVAFLMGIEEADQARIGQLLGTKLALNEHVAYLQMKAWKADPEIEISQRSYQLAAFALTGFANFASVGIQIGGIGAMAPERRGDLARLGMRALFVGFVATLLNAAVAGLFI